MNRVISNANATRRGLSANLWTGRSLDILHSPISEFGYGDFDAFRPYLSEAYDMTEVDDGTSTVTAQSVAGGGIRLAGQDGTLARGPNLQRCTETSGTATGAHYLPSSTRVGYFEAMIRATTLGGTGFFGLGTINDNVLENNGTVTATGANNALGIYLNNTDIRLVSKNGTSFTATTGAGTLVTAQAVKVGFRIDGLTSITPFVNGTAITSKRITTAASFPDGDAMAVVLSGTSSTAATLWDVLWWAIAWEDAGVFVGA